MKPTVRTAVCSSVLFLVALGTALAQQVKTDFDHQANFSRYKTYSWQEVKVADPLWVPRIQGAVDTQLAQGLDEDGKRWRYRSRSDCYVPHRKDTSNLL